MPVPQQPAEQDLDTIQHPLYGTLKFPKTMAGPERNQIIDNLAPAGSPKGGPPIPAAHPPANMRSGLDEISNVTPEQRAGHSGLINAAQDYGANVIGSTVGMLAHPVQAAKGLIGGMDMSNIGPALQEAREHPENKPPLSQAIPAGLGQATGSYLTGEAGIGAGKGLIKGVDAIPRTARANAKFANIEGQMGGDPVPLTKSAPHLQNLAVLDSAGPSMPTTANKLLNRSQSPVPIDYSLARKFQSNLSDLTPQDLENMNRMMKGGVKQLRGGLFEDIKSAADTRGLGEDYASAMKESRQAARLNAAGKYVRQNLGKAALGGAGIGGAYGLYQNLKGQR